MNLRFPRGPKRRSRQVALIVGVVTLVGAGGWFAGTQMQSPTDALAAHQPPKSGPVTVAVARQKLTANVVTQGSVEFGASKSISLSGPVGSASSSKDDISTPLVTRAPKEGVVLTEGSVLMQVSGRPVFVLRGSVPMYRTLGPGVSGDDVEQLQSALRRLGHDPGGVTGHYGQGTATAVTQWYEGKGFQAQKPTADDQTQLGDLEKGVTDAQLALLQAENGGDGGADGGGKGDGGAATPSSSDAEHNLGLKSAQEQLQQANQALSSFKAAYGTKVPAGEVVFLPDLPVRVGKVKVHLGDNPAGAVATVTSSDVVVQAVVPGTDGALLHKGMPARIETTDGKHVTGELAQVGGSAPSGDGAKDGTDGGQETDSGSGDPSAPVQLVISVSEPGALKNQVGTTVKVTVDLGSSKGAVLVVPLAAVHTNADGKAGVRVQRDGKVVDVPVKVGLSAAGQVEVTPDGSTLAEGDQVVVGQ
ncbi:MAG: peptidoglycan-binding protein [Streptomyces sp.]|uniref:peptidoglycan-binding protein n=1 Tax=Streptomyces sp. TaxID=1931 RepID=UPI0025D54C93|nr:peptidoglycan-binding protein [Streptomyces sp.]MBW8801474.1 peptidoglycan-binding protein [Streptomyces sp.]